MPTLQHRLKVLIANGTVTYNEIAAMSGVSRWTLWRLANGRTQDMMATRREALDTTINVFEALEACGSTKPSPSPASAKGTRKAARGTPKLSTVHTATATKRGGMAGAGKP